MFCLVVVGFVLVVVGVGVVGLVVVWVVGGWVGVVCGGSCRLR